MYVVSYSFKLQKKSKLKSKIEGKDVSGENKGIEQKKTLTSNQSQKSRNKSAVNPTKKKEKSVDPDNPFSALLELKNKL